jgi:hypothetical protein
MGVSGTFCHICGIAVQHQHYVASEGGDHWLIYRRENSSCAPAFEIKPEHAWLLRAVAVNLNGEEDPVQGTVEDGALTAHNDASRIVYVDDEMDDWAAVHEYCWEASRHELLPTAPQLHRNLLLHRYQQQLFDFAKLIEDGYGYMLADPGTDARNGARIAELVEAARRQQQLPPPRTAAELAASECWERLRTPSGFFRYRANVPNQADFDPQDKLFLVGITRLHQSAETAESPALDQFESELLRITTAHGVLVSAQAQAERMAYLAYVGDGEAYSQACAALCADGLAEVSPETEPDPGWGFYYEALHHLLAGRWNRG